MLVHVLVRRLAPALALLLPVVARADVAPGRLPAGVRPVFQSIRLNLDPAASEYTGVVNVELEAAAAVSTFAFHAEGMKVVSVSLKSAGGPAVSFTHESGPVTTTVRAVPPLEPGRYALEVVFSNDYRTDGLGLYKVVSAATPYLFTQLEADEARTAFPCWDEPSFKFPYQMTVTLPEAQTAVSNTPVESDTVAAGRRTIVFKKTPPLPSYLLAVAAGRVAVS